MINLLIRLALAGVSMLIGFAGLLLPILPGWLFFGIAALLLFPNARMTRRILHKIEKRFPSTRRVLEFLIPGL